MPGFRTLETFYWVAQLRSFTAAAERLKTTQPAVSARVAALEDEFGIRLLERGPRAVTPTARGRLLLGYVERLLQMRSQMMSAVAAPDAQGGVVRLGVSETIVHTWLTEFLERVHAQFPRVELEIDVDVSPALASRLSEGRLDVAFLLGDPADRSVRTQPLCAYPLAFVASPTLGLPDRLMTLAEIAAWPLITYPRTTRPYIDTLRLFDTAGLSKPRVHSSASLATIVRMTVDGIGISVIPPVVARQYCEAGSLRIVPVDAALPDLTYSVAFTTSDTGLAARLADLACSLCRQNEAASGICTAISTHDRV